MSLNLSKAFADCGKCRKWGDVPQGFKETKHFVQCGNCGATMYYMRGYDPVKDLAYLESNKTETKLIAQ